MTSVPGIDVNAIQQAVRVSFTNGMHHALWFAGGVVLAGAVVAAIMIRGTAPHEQMARQAAAQAAAAAAADRAQGPSESSTTVEGRVKWPRRTSANSSTSFPCPWC